jgi:hypothetical protein
MMGAADMVVEQPIFENAGQAVHVAFLIMAQEATQDAPLRKAIIKAMESVKLDNGQRHWLDQLRGAGGGKVNFEGLQGNEIRAQCVMITQAVKKLPDAEMWVLQAKYGQTDVEDVAEGGKAALAAALTTAVQKVAAERVRMTQARAGLDIWRERYLAAQGRVMLPTAHAAAVFNYQAARDEVRDVGFALANAEKAERSARIACERASACGLVDNGRVNAGGATTRRRFVFSAERIAAIDGLAQWFEPMFPRIRPLAITCMLGRMFATHKKIEISTRDLVASFGGNQSQYLRASWKMKNHVRQLEENAIARLEPLFVDHGISCAV